MPSPRARGSIHGMNDTADILRRLENLIRLGTIAEVDPEPPRVRVETGGLLTTWLPWFARRAGSDRDWDPPSVGEQCMVICPSGDPAIGVVLPGIYSSAAPAPDNSLDRNRRAYRDGAVIEYDTASHSLKATLPAGATAELVAPGGLHIIAAGGVRIDAASGMHIVGAITHEGDYTQTGSQAVTGNVTVSGDVVAAGISLVDHVHGGVQVGGGTTGVPQ